MDLPLLVLSIIAFAVVVYGGVFTWIALQRWNHERTQDLYARGIAQARADQRARDQLARLELLKAALPLVVDMVRSTFRAPDRDELERDELERDEPIVTPAPSSSISNLPCSDLDCEACRSMRPPQP